jgi:adenylate kinase family enzyme
MSSVEKRQDDIDENTIRNRLKEFHASSAPVIDFYQKYGIVKYINSELHVNDAYAQVKESLYPAVYCLIGKKYSGKTTIGKELAKRMGFKIIDFNQFM